MTLWVTLEYMKNEDVIEISYRKFDQNKADGQYPSISVCFVDAYKDLIFEKSYFVEKGINASSYTNFINGNMWDERMSHVVYDNVTLDIKDYLISTCMITTLSRNCQEIQKIDTVVFPSPLGVLKCFSFHHIIGLNYTLNNQKNVKSGKLNLDEVMISINNSIFPNGIRPASGRFLIMFHYPFQIVRSIYTTFYNWPSQENSNSRYYAMQFHIKSVETLKRRKDGNRECYDWKHYDSKTIEDVMQSVGCQPPYWKSKYKRQPCHSSTQMKRIASHYQAKLYQDDHFEKVVPPCVEIKKVDIEFEEDIGDKRKNEFSNDFYDQFASKAGTKDGWFIIHLHFWSSIDFKEIKQIRAYPIMSAIGNASGYVGVLVGASLTQLPHFIFWIISKIKRTSREWKKLRQFLVPFYSIFSGSSTESNSYNGNLDPEVSGGLVVNNEESNMSDRSHEITEICIHETLI